MHSTSGKAASRQRPMSPQSGVDPAERLRSFVLGSEAPALQTDAVEAGGARSGEGPASWLHLLRYMQEQVPHLGQAAISDSRGVFGHDGGFADHALPCRLAERNRLMPGSDGQCSASRTILRLFLAVQLLAYPYPAYTVIGLNTMSLESLQYMQPPLLMSVCKHAAPRVTAKRLSLPAVLAPF